MQRRDPSSILGGSTFTMKHLRRISEGLKQEAGYYFTNYVAVPAIGKSAILFLAYVDVSSNFRKDKPASRDMRQEFYQ